MDRRHRRSGVNFQQLLNKQWAILTKQEYTELQASFKKTDQRNGGISFYDLINIIRSSSISSQASTFLSPMRGRIESTKKLATSRSKYLTLTACLISLRPSKNRNKKTTGAKSLNRTNIVPSALYSRCFCGLGREGGQEWICQ